jgi:predicted HicB family RNase H-like nuclease
MSNTQQQRERYWHVSVWLPREQEQSVKGAAKERGISVNAFVKAAVEEAIIEQTSPTSSTTRRQAPRI